MGGVSGRGALADAEGAGTGVAALSGSLGDGLATDCGGLTEGAAGVGGAGGREQETAKSHPSGANTTASDTQRMRGFLGTIGRGGHEIGVHG